jgi:pimeloyl-ACP methyl ester carboxylesterase
MMGFGRADRSAAQRGGIKTRMLHRFLSQNYFAPTSNVPDSWLTDWWPQAAKAQFAAMDVTPFAEWSSGGSAPILVLQGLNDQLAPPANGYALHKMLGDRVQVVDLPDAGHALLAEQQALVANSIREFLHLQTQTEPARVRA